MGKHEIYRETVDYGLLLLSAALYGSTFMLIAIAVESLAPMTIVAGRQALAAAIFVAIAIAFRQKIPALNLENSRIWMLIFASALFGNSLPFFLTTWGQQKVDAGMAAIIISTMPLMTIVLAHFFSANERLNSRKIAGLAVGFIGVLILFGPEKLMLLGDESVRQFAILGSALSFAINMIIMTYLTRLPRYSLLAAVLGLSFLIALPFSLFEKPWMLDIKPVGVLAVVAIGIITSAIGNLLSFKILERRGAMFNAQTNYVIPIMAIFWAWLILGEVPELIVYLALALILVGIAIVRGAPFVTAKEKGKQLV
ncbi:MAG: DMT family transporter [Rhizobiaceae bacterium]|nr:DMT family transporter [Rhizobiaceae bacterium]